MEHTTDRALLPQSPYKKRSLKPYHIKYYGLIVVFFMMIAAIKVFINYATIQGSIIQVTKETIEIGRHKQYLALQAIVYGLPESQVFISHDNSIVLNNERIFVKIQGTGAQNNTGVILKPNIVLSQQVTLSPFMSRMTYFSEKISR